MIMLSFHFLTTASCLLSLRCVWYLSCASTLRMSCIILYFYCLHSIFFLVTNSLSCPYIYPIYLSVSVVDTEACDLRALNLIEGYTKTVLGLDEQVRLVDQWCHHHSCWTSLVSNSFISSLLNVLIAYQHHCYTSWLFKCIVVRYYCN